MYSTMSRPNKRTFVYESRNNKMNAVSRRKKKRGSIQKRDDKTVSRGSKFTSRIPGQVFADSTIVELIYFDTPTMTNTGALFTNIRFKLNSAYDFDPTLGSTTITGFTELANLYFNYRVMSVKFEVTCCNAEAFASTVYTVFDASGLDPGANNAGSLDWMMNPKNKWAFVAAKGGQDKAKLSVNWNFGSLISREVLTDDSYSSLVSTNPLSLIYGVVGATPVGAFVYTAATGISLQIRAVIRTVFYGRKLLQT